VFAIPVKTGFYESCCWLAGIFFYWLAAIPLPVLSVQLQLSQVTAVPQAVPYLSFRKGFKEV